MQEHTLVEPYVSPSVNNVSELLNRPCSSASSDDSLDNIKGKVNRREMEQMRTVKVSPLNCCPKDNIVRGRIEVYLHQTNMHSVDINFTTRGFHSYVLSVL